VIGVRRGMFGDQGSGDTSGYGRLVEPVSMQGSSPRPYGGYLDDVVDTLADALGEDGPNSFAAAIERVVVYRDELTLEVRREQLPAVAQTLRDHPGLRFELCLGVSGVHYPDDTDRELHAVYPLMSITHNRRIQVEVAAPDADPHIPSCSASFPFPTATTARPTTSSASSSMAIPPSLASKCPMTGRGTRNARTTRWAAYPWSTTGRRSRRPMSGGPTTDEYAYDFARGGRYRNSGRGRR
jgi:hypothetical protein